MKKWVNRINLGPKLYFILMTAVAGIVIVSGMLIYNMNQSAQQLERELYDELYQSTFYLLNADRDFYQADQAFLTALQSEDGREEAAAAYEENTAQVHERMEEARTILQSDTGISSQEVESRYNSFFESLAAWEEQTSSIMDQETMQAQPAEMEEIRTTFENARTEIDQLQQSLESAAVQTVDTIHADNDRMMFLSIGVIVVSIAAVFILGWLLIRHITKPVDQLVVMNEQLAEGNLNVNKMQMNRDDEIGKLAAAGNAMFDHMRDMVRQIQEISEEVNGRSRELNQSSDEVRSGSEQIASTMEELSAGAEEQAGASSDISARMKQLNEQIQGAYEDGETLQQTSSHVVERAEEGRKQMETAVANIDQLSRLVAESVGKTRELDKRSGEISKLVDVIQEISEQTNLLALNAAIEAARAGESGKGFAVVADEVRKLAEQVGTSVTEITDIIEGVQRDTRAVTTSLESGYEQAEEGSRQVHITRENFEEITGAMNEMKNRIDHVSSTLSHVREDSGNVSDSAAEIASTTEESAAGIEQTASTAQEQSASMHEIAAASRSLSQLSDQMDALIKRFSL
ncbi:methyl-accepting chemotaxis protein [Salibacterium sp. K-3]